MKLCIRFYAQSLLLSAVACTIAIGQSTFRIRSLVPDASLPCSTDEAQWWTNLQTAARTVYRTRGTEDQLKAFQDLLAEGREHSYQIPIPDQKPTVLSMTEPEYTEAGRINRVSGDIGLKVEFLADGNVGEVKLINTLGFGLDQKAESAARKTVFLPAVKDRKFVTYASQMHMTFSTY